jgi:hypothetical protein
MLLKAVILGSAACISALHARFLTDDLPKYGETSSSIMYVLFPQSFAEDSQSPITVFGSQL